VASESTTLANFTELLKEYITSDLVKDIGYKDNPLHAIMKKDADANFGGEYKPVPIVYSHNRGSATFATAVAQRRRARAKQFQITTVDDYGVVEIARKALMGGVKDMHAFLSLKKVNIDSTIYAVTRSIAAAEYGTTRGAIGTVGVDPSTGTSLTLANVEDAVNFEEGTRFRIYEPSATADRNTPTYPYEVATIDRDTGVITIDTSLADTAHAFEALVAVSDELVRDGDMSAKMSGLRAWIPPTAPGATSFFGVDRTADVVRLGGCRVTLTGLPITEALMTLVERVNREGGRVSHVFVNPTKWLQLQIALGDKVIFDVAKSSDAQIGFPSIVLHSSKGPVQIVADGNCPIAYVWALTMNTWTLDSIGQAPHVFDVGDSQEWLRYASSDSYEMRVGYYAQIECNEPGANGIGIW
jgi:hypothetical protein